MSMMQEILKELESFPGNALDVDAPIAGVKMYGVTESVLTEVTPCNPDVFAVQEWPVEGTHITLPKATVAAVEITLA